MNNKELFNIDVESNVSEENIILAPPVELFDEAKEIAQSTCSDEKFPFKYFLSAGFPCNKIYLFHPDILG